MDGSEGSWQGLTKSDPTANVRMDCLTQETTDEYLKDTFIDNDFMDSPNQIYNVDKIGMPSDRRAPKIVAGRDNTKRQTSGNKSQVTV